MAEAEVGLGIEKNSEATFGNKKIQKIEILYSLNDSPDHLYVDFEDYGYAVFFASTMEMLEYSPQGNLPFCASDERAFSL
ncbi:MAG: hypothetical protein K5753_04660 [Clostridia bacterium]|nr:hypothetical protein [Clostridia bacterium]